MVSLLSFVCSIGNVPLAAALWQGGISFGGVVSFIFADLITFPLLLIYRRYYGTRLALRMLALFWAATNQPASLTPVTLVLWSLSAVTAGVLMRAALAVAEPLVKIAFEMMKRPSPEAGPEEP